MSTVRRTSKRPTHRPQKDRFFYGWRLVERKGRDGRWDLVNVPLTEDDVLHPQEGDHIMNNDLHTRDCVYLFNVFEWVLAATAGALVLCDTAVYWDDPVLRHHSPDVTVIFGTRRRRKWPCFEVAREGVRPTLLLEVTSPSTRHADLVKKRRQYFRAQVPYYVILDELPQRREEAPRRLRILGYRRGRRGYERMELNEQGRLWLDAVGLWLGVEDGRANCYDREGRRLENFAELHQARATAERRAQTAEERAEVEARARAAAEERVRQLEDELRRRGRNGR